MIDEKQLFIIAVAVLGFLALQLRKRRNILMCMFAANSAFCMHYLLNPSLSGVLMNVMNGLRNLLYAQRDEYKPLRTKALPYIFSVVVLIIGVIVWDGPLTVLFIVGNIVSCFGLRCRHTTNIRKSILISCPLLAVYEFFGGTVIGGCYELLLIVSAIVSLVRYRNSGKHRK